MQLFSTPSQRSPLIGLHHSKLRGRGVDFDQVRVYQAGDDVRTIDWRVTARTQEPHTKLFHEERERPIFHNLVLADEINRAPAKVLSALLEAMAERQVSVGRSTYELSPLFLVMATQNPIEQEGTYPLPEAQLDRFLMHVKIGFPDAAVERRILQQARGEALNGETKPERRVSQQAIFAARKEILGLYMADAVEEYLVQLVMATRTPGKFDPEMAEWIAYGASPRGSIALDRCARAHAWLAGRDFVSPEDIQAVLFDVLRHRIILSFEAEAAGIDQDRVVQRILDVVAVA